MNTKNIYKDLKGNDKAILLIEELSKYKNIIREDFKLYEDTLDINFIYAIDLILYESVGYLINNLKSLVDKKQDPKLQNYLNEIMSTFLEFYNETNLELNIHSEIEDLLPSPNYFR